MDSSPPGSSTHGMLQARIMEWSPFPFPEDHPNPGIKSRSSSIAGRFFTVWATREASIYTVLESIKDFLGGSDGRELPSVRRLAIVLHLKIIYIPLIIIAKNADHHLSLQRIIIFLLLEVLALMLMAADCVRVMVAEGWVGYGNFYKQHWSLPHWWLFLSWMISLQYALVLLERILPTELLSKFESVLSNPATALWTKFI